MYTYLNIQVNLKAKRAIFIAPGGFGQNARSFAASAGSLLDSWICVLGWLMRECAAPCHTLWLLRCEFWFVTWFTRHMNMGVGAVRERVCGALSHNVVRYLIYMTREYVCWGSWSGLYERVCGALSHNTAPSLRVLVCCLIHMTDACIYIYMHIYIYIYI